jgi:hypothetical protein
MVMNKPVKVHLLKRWEALISSKGNNLIITIEGLGYIHDSILKRGINGALIHSNLLKDLKVKEYKEKK